MRPLRLAAPGERLSVLCLGAHSDDIEIGVGGALLTMLADGVSLDVRWCVLSGEGEREREARASAADFLAGAAGATVEVAGFRDGFFPSEGARLKDWFENLKRRVDPDLVFTHRHDDAHQDHREVCRLTWNSFRDHLVLEYEVPKWDGDLGQPNVYVPLAEEIRRRKVALLLEHFGSQRSKDWFDPEVFDGLTRLRGMESRAPDRHAEAFYARKLVLR